MSHDRMLTTFLDLVRIDSPSREEAQVAGYCERVLRDAGFRVHFDGAIESTGSDTGNLIAVREEPGARRTLVLSAHMDCVEPCIGVDPVVEDGVIRSAGDTVLGGDDKVGLAVILEFARSLVEGGARGGVTPINVRVVFTVCEEIGLRGAKALSSDDVAGDLCLVLDADGAPGGLVVGAPTHHTFIARFSGTAAHAGVAPEQGRSALVMASRAVCAMELGRLDEATTANIGSITGGGATNVVAPRAIMTGECRSLDAHRVEAVRADMDSAMRSAASEGGGSVEIEWTKEYQGFLFDDEDPMLTLVRAACEDAGLEPRPFKTGGGSDGNILFAAGVPTVVLSSGMSDVHTTEETVRVSDMEALFELVVAVARRLSGGGE